MKLSILLASNSPRRKEILSLTDIPFRVQSSDIEENYPNDILLNKVPEFLAQKKGRAALSFRKENEIVLAADTLVFLENEILSKPENEVEAFNMIKKMSGKTHMVITGVYLSDSSLEEIFCETTFVTFNDLSDYEIEYYVQKYKPFDKAGAYACQEWIGAIAISKFEGDYYNVVGLPIQKIYRVLKNKFQQNYI